MKTKKSFIIFILLLLSVLLVNAFIFYNSLKDQSASSRDSDKVVFIFDFIWKLLDVNDVDLRSRIIRKLAHFSEFCLLGFCAESLNIYCKKNYSRHFPGFVLFYGLSVAVTDEFLQGFSDRASQVTDSMLDFSGFIFGVFIIFAICGLISICKNKRITAAERKNL